MLFAFIRLYSRWNYPRCNVNRISNEIEWHFNLHVRFIRKTWNLFYNIHSRWQSQIRIDLWNFSLFFFAFVFSSSLTLVRANFVHLFRFYLFSFVKLFSKRVKALCVDWIYLTIFLICTHIYTHSHWISIVFFSHSFLKKRLLYFAFD